MWYLKLRTFITSLLKLVAVFIIAAVILLATEIGNLFNATAACLSDAVNCSPATFQASGGS